jgi:predicted lipoprotein
VNVARTVPRRQVSASAGVLLPILLGVLLLVSTACGGDDTADRGDVVGALADTVAVPEFTEFASLADGLDQSAIALCAAPSDAALVDARTDLADARASWRRSEAVWVGPVMDRRSWSVVDWPIVPADIDTMLADTTIGPLDAQYLATRVGAPLRGLGAIEYVLFADGAVDDLADPRRCEYLQGLAGAVANEAHAVLALWTTGDGEMVPYRDEFAGDTDLMTATDSIDALVNSMLTRLEGSVNRELGRALGLTATGTAADVSGIVEGAGGFGVSDQAARAEGVRLVLLGTEGASGLSPLLADDLRDRLATQFDAVDTALDAIDPPLVAAVADQSAAVTAAHDAYSTLRVTISTEVVSALGVTVSFSDADGDSAG